MKNNLFPSGKREISESDSFECITFCSSEEWTFWSTWNQQTLLLGELSGKFSQFRTRRDGGQIDWKHRYDIRMAWYFCILCFSNVVIAESVPQINSSFHIWLQNGNMYWYCFAYCDVFEYIWEIDCYQLKVHTVSHNISVFLLCQHLVVKLNWLAYRSSRNMVTGN